MTKQKMKLKKCLYCGGEYHSKGFCRKHYMVLYNHNQNITNTREALIYLRNRDKQLLKYKLAKPDKCLFCGDKIVSKGYCNKHYSALRRYRYNLDNTEECLEFLKNNYYRVRLDKCLFCGDKHLAMGFCSKHYMSLYRHKQNMYDIQQCLEFLKNRKR